MLLFMRSKKAMDQLVFLFKYERWKFKSILIFLLALDMEIFFTSEDILFSVAVEYMFKTQ